MISSAMAEILRLLYAEARPQLSDDCAGVLGMDHLALSLSVAGHATEQLWSSGKTSSLFEDLQFTLGEGPGPDAVRTGLLVLAHDVSAVWPADGPLCSPPWRTCRSRPCSAFPYPSAASPSGS